MEISRIVNQKELACAIAELEMDIAEFDAFIKRKIDEILRREESDPETWRQKNAEMAYTLEVIMREKHLPLLKYRLELLRKLRTLISGWI